MQLEYVLKRGFYWLLRYYLCLNLIFMRNLTCVLINLLIPNNSRE